jgi:hypothetical protein
MTSLDSIWSAIEAAGEMGGSRRVNEERGHDFYASVNLEGQRGLLLISTDEPPPAPDFDAVQITIVHRPDQRWLLSIWLKEPVLSSIFAELCQNLVDASGIIEAKHVPAFVFSRLLKWRRLLEAGSLETLGILALRGLIGELVVLKHCLSIWPPQVSVDAWVGPFHAPQDFAFPQLLIETKAVMRAAPTVRISSVEQLDVPEGTDLRLAIVSLAPIAPQSSSGFSPIALVNEIREALLAEPQALADFESRLSSAGFAQHEDYERIRFRFEDLRFYAVEGSFPRIKRTNVPRGITTVSYEISIGSCEQYEKELDNRNGC